MPALQPPELVESLRTNTEDDALRETWFLLVRVPQDADEVRHWLSSSFTASGARLTGSRESMAFSTSMMSVSTMRERMLLSRPAWTPASVTDDLVTHDIFVLPLRKRARKPFAERISVGRAPNNDVVLRHATISKFQAWFELDYDNQLWLADAGSTNPTMVDGHTLAPRAAEKVGLGIELRFGDLVCAPVDHAFAMELVARVSRRTSVFAPRHIERP